MVKYVRRLYEDGLMRLPKELREQLGDEVEVFPNAVGAYLKSKNATLDDAIESLKIIIQDLELRKRLEG